MRTSEQKLYHLVKHYSLDVISRHLNLSNNHVARMQQNGVPRKHKRLVDRLYRYTGLDGVRDRISSDWYTKLSGRR